MILSNICVNSVRCPSEFETIFFTHFLMLFLKMTLFYGELKIRNIRYLKLLISNDLL